MNPVEPTELVAGAWQLRPWPVAHADLDDVLRERYADDELPREREARLLGWSRGDLLSFSVREATTGASVAEVLVVVTPHGHASVAVRARADHLGARLDSDVEDVVRRWAAQGLGLTLA